MKDNARHQMFNNVKRVYDRLVNLGYARPVVWDESDEDWSVNFTESGDRLQSDFLKIFDMPNRKMSDIGVDEVSALWMLMVASHPPV